MSNATAVPRTAVVTGAGGWLGQNLVRNLGADRDRVRCLVRTADVVALSDVVALEIGKSSFEAILHNHPELTNAISHQIMQRRAQLESLHVEEQEQEELTLISRIKSYFGM